MKYLWIVILLVGFSSCKPTAPQTTAPVLGAGINHLEFWVSDWAKSEPFYKGLFKIIGWQQITPRGFTSTTNEIYFQVKKDLNRENTLGVRHICFQATSRQMVEDVAAYLKSINTTMIRGPQEMPYTKGYYTVDFYDPDGYVLEVAYTPNMNRGKK